MKKPTCNIHGTVLLCPACVGAVTSEAKAAAARANGLKGGRPYNLRGGRPRTKKPRGK